MKVGLIGCGGMGTTHNLSLKALSNKLDIQVTAIAEIRPEFLEKAANLWPEAKTYATGMELIEQEQLDVVHICLPSYMHTEHAVEAMKKGFHVFIEKPVCLTKEDGEELLEAEKKYGVQIMVGQVIRSFEEYGYLKEVYDKNTFGKLKSLVLKRMSGDVIWGYEDWFHDEEKSGSAVLDLHIHDLDFLRYMLGEPDSFEVRATSFDSGMINQIITLYEFGSVFATAEGMWDVSPAIPFEAEFRACFEEATLVFKSSLEQTLTIYKKDGTLESPEFHPEYNVENEESEINVSNLGPYYTEIKYFLECLRDGKKASIAPLIEGVKSVNLALMEWEAAKQYVKRETTAKR